MHCTCHIRRRGGRDERDDDSDFADVARATDGDPGSFSRVRVLVGLVGHRRRRYRTGCNGVHGDAVRGEFERGGFHETIEAVLTGVVGARADPWLAFMNAWLCQAKWGPGGQSNSDPRVRV